MDTTDRGIGSIAATLHRLLTTNPDTEKATL